MSVLYAKLIAWLVKWGALLVFLLAGCLALFVGGCNYGSKAQSKRGADAMSAADARANGYAAQVSVLAQAIAVIDADTANALALAAEQAKRADVAEKRAATIAKGYAKEVAQVDRDLAKAQRDPTCKQILESRSCAALR